MGNNSVLAVIRKRWILIVIVGFLSACLFMGYKYLMRDTYTVAYDGDVRIEKTIKIESYEDRHDILRYDAYYKSRAFLCSFLDVTEERYEYEKFARGWNQKGLQQKVNWLSAHLGVNYFGAGRVGFALVFKGTEPVDLVYVEEHGMAYLQDFLSFVDQKDSLGDYIVLDEAAEFPKETVIEQSGVFLKYGGIGFVLGVVGMTTVLLVWNLRKGCYGDN